MLFNVLLITLSSLPSLISALDVTACISCHASLVCEPFHAKGATSQIIGKYKIHFFNNNPTGNPALGPSFSAPTLPGNATMVANHFIIDIHGIGSSFQVETCNSTGAGVSSTTQSTCFDGGCAIAYTDYAQVKHTASGSPICLTNVAFDNNPDSTDFIFTNCSENYHPNQLFLLTQRVLYTSNFGSVASYGNVTFTVNELGMGDNGPFRALSLDRDDNKTIQVVKANYTQVGLAANLLA